METPLNSSANNYMRLFVDDYRRPPEGWTLARTIEDAIQCLDTAQFQEVSLDYVIGEDPRNNFSKVAHHIVGMPAQSRPKIVYIHTSSGEGARELKAILQGHIKNIVRR